MVAARLPDEGPVRFGPVDLPPGRLIMGCVGLDHVAWVTKDPVPDVGRVWAALSGLHPRTGLVPIQVDGRSGKVRDPLNLSWTEDPRDADGLDVGAMIEERWQDGRPDEPDLGWAELRAPFTGYFDATAEQALDAFGADRQFWDAKGGVGPEELARRAAQPYLVPVRLGPETEEYETGGERGGTLRRPAVTVHVGTRRLGKLSAEDGARLDRDLREARQQGRAVWMSGHYFPPAASGRPRLLLYPGSLPFGSPSAR